MDRIPDFSSEENLNRENSMIRILIVDDEKGMCLLLEDILKDCGYFARSFTRPEDALGAFREELFQVVFTDIKMPEMDGIQLLKEILSINSTTSVVMITAYGSIENAVNCMELGAFNYISKPFKSEEIIAVIKKAIERVHLINENIALKQKLKTLTPSVRIVGKSAMISETLKFAEKVAQTNFKVLITGESGTGKELFARYLHDMSHRGNGPFIPVQCSLLPESLLESELFGHKKGSFTGASADRKGLFEEADQGTIFLDEIGDINMNIQGKLLRFLQEKEIKRIGDTKSRLVDVRLVFATNKNLLKLVQDNQFRDDLYYRIKEVEIKIPPLRERKEDILSLTRYFLQEISREAGNRIEMDEGIIDLLLLHNWPGNIRELKNCLTSAAAICENNIIRPQHISKILMLTQDSSTYSDAGSNYREMRKKLVSDFDRMNIISSLVRNNGNMTKTATDLGIDKKNLWMMIKKYGIDCDAYKK